MAIQLPNSKRALIEKASSSIFVAVAGAAIIVAFCLVALNFMWDQAQFNSRVHAEKREARDTLVENVKNAVALQDSFADLESGDDLIPEQNGKKNSAVILDALPRKYDFPALRTSIDKLANLSSVNLRGVSGRDQESDAIDKMINPEPQDISFSVTIEGDKDSIFGFIETLENTIRPIRVLNYRVSGSDETLSASLELETYYQPSVDIQIQTRVIE